MSQLSKHTHTGRRKRINELKRELFEGPPNVELWRCAADQFNCELPGIGPIIAGRRIIATQRINQLLNRMSMSSLT